MYLFMKVGKLMTIHDYVTNGGKNLIKEYLKTLPTEEAREGYVIRHNLIINGLSALQELNTRQLKGKLWEIKFSKNRIIEYNRKTPFFRNGDIRL